MSKYTTEVRYVCEQKAGLVESVGFSGVDDVLEKCWDKVITSRVKMFDEDYRKVLYKKILKHYYTREIGAETVGLWQLWVNTRLEEIMPYYNQLYESELIKIEPLKNVDYSRTYDKKGVGSKQETGRADSTNTDSGTSESSRTSNGSSSESSGSTDLYSDTPQGAITGLEEMKYLTNARKVDATGSSSDSNTEKYNGSESNTAHLISDTANTTTHDDSEVYTEKIVGKTDGASMSALLMEFRQSFLNIDMQVIGEFSDLFINLW